MIPKIIHQTVGPYVPPGGQECLDSVVRHHPDWEVRLYDNEQMYTALGLEPGSLVGVEAADLFRLKILSEEGGWYLDADMYCIGPLPDDGDRFISWEETGWMPFKVISNWAMACKPGDPYIEACLEEGTYRLKNPNEGTLYKAGPGMMTSVYFRKDWGFEPIDWPLVGSRWFDRMNRPRSFHKDMRGGHLFMGCWYKEGWAGGFLPKVRMVQDYERSFAPCA